MDETSQVPESIYFFYGGESEQFVNALEFIGLSPINREFSVFLLSDLGRKTTTQNKLSIHVESVISFTIIIIRVKNFTTFYCLNKTTRQRMFLKNYLIKIVFRHISALFCRAFLSTTKKSLIFLPLKIQNIFFIVLMTLSRFMETLGTNYFIREKC